MKYSEQLLNKCEAKIIISMLPTAMNLAIKYGKYFEQPEPGIYVVNETSPRLKIGQVYFHKTKTEGYKKVDNINLVKSDILDSSGNIALPYHYIKNKHIYLSAGPSIPVTELNIVFACVKNQLDRIAQWRRNYGSETNVLKYIKSGFEDIYHDGTIESEIRDILTQVETFIGYDNWYIYSETKDGVNLIIDKICDYRIYSYHMNEELMSNKHED